MKEQFKIKLENNQIDLWNLYEYIGISKETANIDDVKASAVIEYDVDIDMVNYGIRDVSFNIRDVVFTLDIVIDKHSLTTEEIATLRVAFEENESTFRIEFEIGLDETWGVDNELSIGKNNGVPENLSIELTAKRMTVS